MEGKLRNMVSLYLMAGDRMLLLYRVGSRVLKNPCWCGIGGHFEKEELNDARAALLREVSEEIGLEEKDLENLRLRYITLWQKEGEIRQNYYFLPVWRQGRWFRIPVVREFWSGCRLQRSVGGTCPIRRVM